MTKIGLKTLGVIIGVGATLALGLDPGPSEGAPARSRPLVILPFQATSPGETESWIGEGVAEALHLAFTRVSAVLPVDRARLEQVRQAAKASSFPSDERGAATLAKALQADLVFFGTYRREPEGNVILQARYLDVKGGEGRPVEVVRGPVERLLELQGDLVGNYLKALRLSAKPDEAQAIAAAARPTVSLVAYEAYVRGRRLSRERTRSGFEGASELYSRAVEVDPGFAVAHFHLGMAQLALGNRWKAAAQFRAASQTDPRLPEPYQALGDLFMKGPRRLYDQAIEAYQKAIALRPHFADAYVGLGDARAAKGDHEGALAEYNRALAVDASSARVHLSMGKIYYNDKGLYYEAVASYRKAIDIDPQLLEARMGLGEIFEEKGLYKDAITEYQKVVDADPGHTGALYNLALAYEKVDVKQAILHWERYIALASGIPTEKDWVDVARQHLRKLRAMEKKE